MKSFLDSEIEELKNNIIKMAILVEEQFQKVVFALETGDKEILFGIKEKDSEIDAFDLLIQTQCENILAIHQPVASDLRLVMAAIMINNQLERCGDLSVKISNRFRKVAGYMPLVYESRINEMAAKCFNMLKSSINSFLMNDSNLANQVILDDDLVDDMNSQCFEFLTIKMASDLSLVEPCSHILILARHLERLADHTTNISENVIFNVNGQFVTHRNIKESFSEDEED